MRQRAEIIQAVEIIYGSVDQIADQPNNEPIMRLEDGRQVPAYFCERYVQKGTKGWATLDTERGIWAFNADEPEPEPFTPLPPAHYE